ncbi:MAG: G8 domain-containing protein [Planctomycetota bacterium]
MKAVKKKARAMRSRRKQNSFSFETLEPRKLMAADLLAANPIGVPGEMPHTTIMGPQAFHNCNQSHPDVMALVSDAQATHFATGSGRWVDPSVWQNGVVPTSGARVVIGEGHTVTVDTVNSREFKTVRVDGTLRFATNVSSELRVDTLVTTHCGTLEMGTATNPMQPEVRARIVFADDGAIDRNWDPKQLSRGALLMGRTELAGAPTTDKVVLAVQPTAGQSSLTLEAVPTNWRVGDQLVVTGTDGPTSDEVRTIASINGTNVQLNQALAVDHVAPKSSLNVYVANTTRNVQFASENTATLRRGHIMIMHTHNAAIDNAGFYDLGRTDKSRDLDDLNFEFDDEMPGNQAGAPVHFQTSNGPANNIRGRYAVHFHRGGTEPGSIPATVNGSVVFGSPGWGFVNHSSHVNFTNNVAYGVFGAAYYTEAGDEIGTFDGNIAIRSVNPRNPVNQDDGAIDPDLGHEQQEFGNSGDGFWLSGHLVSVKNNISSGSSGHGIIIWSDGLVEADRGRATVATSSIPNGNLITGRDSIPVWWAPMAEIADNEVSGSTIGFRTRYIHSQTYLGEGGSDFHARPDQAYIDTLHPVIDGLKVWGNRDGIMMNYSERVTLRNAEVVGIGAPWVLNGGTANLGAGLDLGTEVSRGSGRIQNVSIEGFEMGFVAPRNDQWTFDNMTFKNVTDMLITEPQQAPRTMTMSNFTFGSLDGTAVANSAGSRRNIVMTADFEGAGYQPYFFVLPDRITLDGQGIFYQQQAANFTPLEQHPEESHEQIPQSYINKTNQQLQNRFGLSFGGAILPSNAQNVSWLTGGRVGTAAPAATNFPRLIDMTNEGFNPEPPPGGPNPELTGNRLEIGRGETVTFLNKNLNTTDTNTGIAGLQYTVSQIQNGFFAHRNAPSTPITTFSQAQVNGGVIRFVHNGSNNAPAYRVRVTDGNTTTPVSDAQIVFNGQDTLPVEIGFSGIATGVSHQWKTVTLLQSFNNPVVVAGGASRVGGHQGVVRVRNLTSNSFQIRFQEWDYLDGAHALENIGYLVVEAGEHILTDGTRLIAGTTSLTNGAFNSVGFGSTFGGTPVVLAQSLTNNDPGAVTDRIHNVSTTGFDIRLQEEEGSDQIHGTESVGWIAIDQGSASSGDTSLNSVLAEQAINHRHTRINFGSIDGSPAPVILSDMQTRLGGDTATIRHRSSTATSVTLFVEEERSANNEVQHLRESVGVLAIEPGVLIAGNPLRAQDGSAADSPVKRTLRNSDIESLRSDAGAEWANLGFNPSLFDGVQFEIRDLKNGVLGMQSGRTIILDDDGAGQGWYVDDDATTDEAFAGMDLYTTIMHEFGHILGMSDLTSEDEREDIMFAFLEAGIRKTPQTVDDIDVDRTASVSDIGPIRP